jgi:hypothetical protein
MQKEIIGLHLQVDWNQVDLYHQEEKALRKESEATWGHSTISY